MLPNVERTDATKRPELQPWPVHIVIIAAYGNMKTARSETEPSERLLACVKPRKHC